MIAPDLRILLVAAVRSPPLVPSHPAAGTPLRSRPAPDSRTGRCRTLPRNPTLGKTTVATRLPGPSHPAREWTTGGLSDTLTLLLLWSCPFDRGRHKQNPDRSNDRGFPFLRVALPYQSLRFASAMMTAFKPARVQNTSLLGDRLQHDDLVRRQKGEPFDLGLCDQDAVEWIHVDWWKQIHGHGVCGIGHGQFHINRSPATPGAAVAGRR